MSSWAAVNTQADRSPRPPAQPPAVRDADGRDADGRDADRRERAQRGQAAESGLSVPEYERRVWDMSRNLVHPAALYALIEVVGLTRLTSHPAFHRVGSGAWGPVRWEWALFLASFLGAWAVFYSTLLRDAGLRSRTVTLLVPAALLALLAGWLLLPAVADMSDAQALAAAAALAAPGPLAWIVTMARWRRARAEVRAVLADGESR